MLLCKIEYVSIYSLKMDSDLQKTHPHTKQNFYSSQN